MPTTFESFYFFQLLDKIRANGQQQYEKDDISYLETLLNYMESEEDAHSSIEKLAIAQDTSDLAIFFSDILEQLHLMPPDNSMERLEERAGDFSELFQLYLQSEDWKASFSMNINGDAPKETDIPEPMEEPAEIAEPESAAISLEEFCDRVLREKIEKQTSALPQDRAQRFEDQLHQFLQSPDLADELANQIHLPEAGEFRDIVNTMATNSDTPAEVVMSEFNARAEKLLHLFYNLQETRQPAIDSVLKTEEETPVEEPLENLFADAEALIDDSDEAIDFSNIEATAASMTDEQFDESALRSSEPTEEERERRKFLKDYVTGEVSSFSIEIMDKLEHLIVEPGSESAFHELQESLKGMRDLGQIHSYPAIEELSSNLSRLFNEANEGGKTIPAEAKDKLADLLQTLPKYIEASLDDQENNTVAALNDQLSDLKALLL
ncbi:MAG: hypothetical protein AAFP70_05705, partial [Calditrichota bacterium]